jgi:hypothetical protein
MGDDSALNTGACLVHISTVRKPFEKSINILILYYICKRSFVFTLYLFFYSIIVLMISRNRPNLKVTVGFFNLY